jgi:hypothetical protein
MTTSRGGGRGGIPELVTPVSRRDAVHVEAIDRQADGGGSVRVDRRLKPSGAFMMLALGVRS